MKEKEILQKVSQFEKETQENKGEIERVKYYEKFQMSGIDFKNVFITTEKDVDGNITYHMYSGNSSKEIVSVTSNEETSVNSELKSYIRDISIEKVIQENEKEQGRLRAILGNITSTERNQTIKNQQKEQEDREKTKNISIQQEIKTTTKINEKHQLGTELGIEKYNQSNSKFTKIAVVYADDLKQLDEKNVESTRYAFIGIRQDGTMQRLDDMLEMDSSFGNINTEETIQFQDDGTAKKDSSTISRYKIKGTNDTIAIQKDHGGNLDVYYGGRGKGSNEIVESKIETSQTRVMSREQRETQSNIKGEYYEKEQMREGNVHFEEHGEEKIATRDADGDENTKTHDIVDEKSQPISEDDLIPYTNITWKEFANKCGYRGDGAIEHAKEVFDKAKENNKDKTNEEIVDEITEEAEEEFSGPRG